jgi:2-keto-3-deoxy-L-rhamnonate aldolase RhmA
VESGVRCGCDLNNRADAAGCEPPDPFARTSSRSASFVRAAPYDEYVEKSNKETLVLVQIETQKAVDATPSILEVARVELGVLVGRGSAAESWRHREVRHIALNLEGLIRESSRSFQSALRA